MLRVSALLRLLIDTNVIVSGIAFRRGNPYELLERWQAGAFRLVTFQEQIDEVADVLARPKFSGRVDLRDVKRFLRLLAARAVLVEPGTAPVVVRDPKDQDILGAAIAGQADYLVTGDADLLVLAGDARLGSLQIVTVADFFRLTSS